MLQDTCSGVCNAGCVFHSHEKLKLNRVLFGTDTGARQVPPVLKRSPADHPISTSALSSSTVFANDSSLSPQCPRNSSSPSFIPAGFVGIGPTPLTQTGLANCSAGFFCIGVSPTSDTCPVGQPLLCLLLQGVQTPCPLGQFSDVTGLSGMQQHYLISLPDLRVPVCKKYASLLQICPDH